MRYCLAFLVGIFSAFFGFLLLQKTGIYSLGVSALFQGISRLIFFFATKNQASNSELIYAINFWILNLLFNLPLAWFAYLKIGKHFSLLSIVSIISSSLMGLILSTIPGLKDFYIFGNPLTEDSQLFSNKIQILQ